MNGIRIDSHIQRIRPVFRFWEEEILDAVDECVELVLDALHG